MAFGKNLILVAGVCIFGMGILAQSAPAQPPTPAPAAAGLTDTPVAPPNNEATRLAGITKDNSRMFGSSPDDPGPLAKDLSPALTQAAVGAAIRKVADWQLAQSQQYFTAVDRARQLDGRIWTWSVLYTGYMAAYSTLGEGKYRDAMEQIGKGYNWGLRSNLPSGDDMSIAQMYLELYLIDKQPEQIAPIRTALDAVLAARASLSAPASASPGGGAMRSLWPRPPGRACTPPPATPNTSPTSTRSLPKPQPCSTTSRLTSTRATPASSPKPKRMGRSSSGRAAKVG